MKLDKVLEAVVRRHKNEQKKMAVCTAVAIAAGVTAASIVFYAAKSSKKFEIIIKELKDKIHHTENRQES